MATKKVLKKSATSTKKTSATSTKKKPATATKKTSATATKKTSATSTKKKSASATKKTSATSTKKKSATATKKKSATATKKTSATATKKTSATPAASASMPVVGTRAPAFSCVGDDGATHTLSQHRGKHVVLFFYPRDSTPGCTTEACGLRDAMPRFQRQNVVVIGVSKDSVASHVRFKEKQGLNFTLLADTDLAIHHAYGAWGEKMMYGRAVMGCRRSTFLIGPTGVIEHVWSTVKVKTHADDVLAVLA